VLRELKPGAAVIAGTVLGRVGAPSATEPSHIHFEVRPAGKGAPEIDPRPILDGWRLLDSTQAYGPSGDQALSKKAGPVTVRELMKLQGTLRPNQIVSLLDFGQNTVKAPDHADHIHVGFRPLYGDNAALGKAALSVLGPQQWSQLAQRLGQIGNPVVPTVPSKFALPDSC